MATDKTFDTYKAVGIREDLLDVIEDISPTDTPFCSNVGSGTSKGTYHEWQKDSLAAPGDTPRPEGFDADPVALTPTIRLGNYTQINDKAYVISGSDLKADNAGRGVEMAYQEAKKGLELRKDLEFAMVGVNKARNAGAGNDPGAAAARESASVTSWIATNTNHVGTDPTGDGTDARVDGTPRAFTEDMLTDVIDQCYLAGANPTVLMTNTVQKRVITESFTGRATSVDATHTDKKIVNAVDFYDSDYGVMSIVPNRYMRQSDVFCLTPSMWSVDYYRPYFSHELAKSGDNEKRQMIVEWTLRAGEEAANGGVFDLS
jgi:hypothetical protein